VLGFEFGYSWASPDSLVIWEAQFGDFSNGAQTIIDQFISAGESKWQRMSGITLLLPHGYEGQGPEHSSARLERFLQSCAELNIQVCNITTPANLFHAMRRQLNRDFRKPLVIMSPKSLLRHPRCVSDSSEITNGGFQELIDDVNVSKTSVKKVVMCSGKLFYDILDKKEKDHRSDVAIVRMEQLYPLPTKQLEALRTKYSKAKFIWAQEEPANMGAWMFINTYLPDMNFELISRKASASPASGYNKVHQKEQFEIVEKAFS
jgi:2-oxoglutarate dehydrogenase E1 component